MAIGRISGSMLKSNLTRNGVDLAFETNILYLDVTNARVGIGTSTPSTALQVEGTTTTTGLVAGGLTYPTYDGSNGQVMTTNGSGVLGFTSLSEFTGITFVGDDSTGSTINTAETLKFSGASGITTAVVNDTVTITGPDLSSYLTNSTITVVGDDSTGTTLNTGETVKIAGGNNITTAVSGDILTITGSKDIDVNSISSGDSSAIQINDAVNVSGTFRAATIVTNDLISEDSTAINVLDGMNVLGTLTANTAVINNINTADSSDIHINGAFVNFAGGGTVLYDEQATLNNLYDVEITNPQTDQFLRYNGAHWVNGQGATVSAGVGVGFWLTAPTISGVNANNANPVASLSISPGTTTELTITKVINSTTDIVAAFVSGALNRTVWDGGNWLFSNHVYVDSQNGTSTITDAIYTVLPFVTGTVTITGTGTSRTATASAGTPFATAAIDASAVNTDASYLQTPQGLYQITARSSNTVVTITTPSGYTNESAVAGTVWKKWFVGNASAEINNTTVAQVDTDTTKGALSVTTDTRIGLIIFGTTTSNRTVSIMYDASLNASSFTTPLAALHRDLAGLQGGQSNEFYHLTAAEYTGTGTGAFVRAIGADLTNPHITGSLHVTTIDSTDSTTIEINSGVDVNGTLLAPTFITNNISSSDSTAIQIDDAVNVGGTLSADVLDVNEISSSDSTAIQINDAVNIAGILSVSGNKISNVSDPVANQDAATKKYVDDQVIASGSGTVVSITAGTGLTASPSNPITTTGTISLDFSTVVARVVGDDSTGTDLRVGETVKIAGGNNITTAVASDTLTITGSKDIDINSISSTDSTAIQVNDSLNASGTITAASFVTHGASGNITGVNNIEVNQISSNDSTAVQVADGMNVLGTLTANTFVTNNISSSESSAIQINDAVNIAGILSVSGNKISNVSDPVANQDAATKKYVDDQLSAGTGTFYVADDTSTIATIDSGDTLRIIGSGGITTAVSGDTLTITGANQAQGITFFDDASTSTAIPDGGALQITSGEGISTSILGNVLTITNTSTQLEIDGGSAYSVYNAISEALIDGGSA